MFVVSPSALPTLSLHTLRVYSITSNLPRLCFRVCTPPCIIAVHEGVDSFSWTFSGCVLSAAGNGTCARYRFLPYAVLPWPLTPHSGSSSSLFYPVTHPSLFLPFGYTCKLCTMLKSACPLKKAASGCAHGTRCATFVTSRLGWRLGHAFYFSCSTCTFLSHTRSTLTSDTQLPPCKPLSICRRNTGL